MTTDALQQAVSRYLQQGEQADAEMQSRFESLNKQTHDTMDQIMSRSPVKLTAEQHSQYQDIVATLSANPQMIPACHRYLKSLGEKVSNAINEALTVQ